MEFVVSAKQIVTRKNLS